jgi:hypothetical protein
MRKVVLTLLVLISLCSCGPLISDYSIEAYKNATSLKAETGALIEKSGQSYASMSKDIDANTTKINAAYEFAAGLPYNSLSAQQWQILRDPDGALYGYFIKYWKSQGTVSRAFRTEFKQQLDDAFDTIICLEANKQTLTPCHQAGAAAQTGGNQDAGGKAPATAGQKR